MTNHSMRNVGTETHPVSWLHQRAVGIIYDALAHEQFQGPIDSREGWNQVRVNLKPGGPFSNDLRDGVSTVIVPGEWDSVGGLVPDLICKDEKGNPVRIIEVVVTNSPNAAKRQKLETLKRRGVDCVEIEVHTEEDLKNLCWMPAPFHFATYDGRESLRRKGVNVSSAEEQMQAANESIGQLITDLIACSPKHRRQVLEVLRGMNRLESTWPIHPKNPLREQLNSNGSGDNSAQQSDSRP